MSTTVFLIKLETRTLAAAELRLSVLYDLGATNTYRGSGHTQNLCATYQGAPRCVSAVLYITLASKAGAFAYLLDVQSSPKSEQ